MVATRALDRFYETKPPTAQRQLLDIWLSLPRGEAREQFFFEYVASQRTPEENLAAWVARETAPVAGRSKEEGRAA